MNIFKGKQLGFDAFGAQGLQLFAWTPSIVFHVFLRENTSTRKAPLSLSVLQLKRWLHLPLRDEKCFAFQEVEVNKN